MRRKDIKTIRTGISQPFWCQYDGEPFAKCQLCYQEKDSPYCGGKCSLKCVQLHPAVIRKLQRDGSTKKTCVSWLDRLFNDEGIKIPAGASPLVFLLTGPPGSGKSTLALELCYRQAAGIPLELDADHPGAYRPGQAMRSLYISADTSATALIQNAKSFGWNEFVPSNCVLNADGITKLENARKLFEQNGHILLFGKNSVREGENRANEPSTTDDDRVLLDRIVEETVAAFARNLKASDEAVDVLSKAAVKGVNGLYRLLSKQGRTGSTYSSPDILVLDSLNICGNPEERNRQFVDFIRNVCADKRRFKGLKLLIIVADAKYEDREYNCIQYMADTVVRMDYESRNDYFVRNIEIVKARFQKHVLGKHYVKIMDKFNPKQIKLASHRNTCDYNILHQRSHPQHKSGGIVICPSIHSYLSEYRRTTSPLPAEPLSIFPLELDSIVSLPRGRTSMFVGGRGSHKSHLALYCLLFRMLVHGDSGLVISLREDEKRTGRTIRAVLAAICKQITSWDESQMVEWEKKSTKESVADNLRAIRTFRSGFEKESHERQARGNHSDRGASEDQSRLEYYLNRNRLEIVHYLPGYITPNEFFHRVYIAVHRLRYKIGRGKDVVAVFNSLDEMESRFPLCAKETLFMPSILELFSGEKVTSIVVAPDRDQALQHGLLPMSDLVLSFQRRRLTTNDKGEIKYRSGDGKSSTETLLEVDRISGGFKAGSRGVLWLGSDQGRTDRQLFFHEVHDQYPWERTAQPSKPHSVPEQGGPDGPENTVGASEPLMAEAEAQP